MMSILLRKLKETFYRNVAREISLVSQYFEQVVFFHPREGDVLALTPWIQAKARYVWSRDECRDEGGKENPIQTLFLLHGNLNYSLDIEDLLRDLNSVCERSSRVLIVMYNPYLSGLYRLLTWLGIRSGELPCTFVTWANLIHLTCLSQFEVVRRRRCGYWPFRWRGLGTFLERLFSIVPLLKHLGLVELLLLRPQKRELNHRPLLSVVIPSRNEKGNIEPALKRLESLDIPFEVVFVEGGSTDDTWDEIRRLILKYQGSFSIQAFQQSGRGKADAVRLGFAKAKGELLSILDADLTTPPELLPRFYRAFVSGMGDFISGSRLIYPMEGEAMRFINRIGNVFFAKTLSYVMDTHIGDSLCGTKLLSKRDYGRMLQWREQFGNFDPFGDFELLFPAAVLGLGIVDVPIRYRARTYGQTNIHRFRHGFLLLKMVMVGFLKIKLGF